MKADFANYIDGAPTKFSARLDRLKADLAARGDTPATHLFQTLGYPELELSAEIGGAWREDQHVFTLERARLDAKDMAALDVGADFGNVGAAVFSPSPLVSRAAMLTANITRLEATLQGGGLIDRALAQEAKTGGGDIKKLRADYATDLAAAVEAMLGDTEKARRIGAAVEKFVNHPDQLRIKLTSAKGVGALEVDAKAAGRFVERDGGRGRGAVRGGPLPRARSGNDHLALTRFATSLFSHFHRSTTRGVAHSMKAPAHCTARQPAFVAHAMARSNQGNNGLLDGIFARVQATKSRASSEIARHNMAPGFSPDTASTDRRKRANSAARSALLRRSSSIWRASSWARAVSSLARAASSVA